MIDTVIVREFGILLSKNYGFFTLLLKVLKYGFIVQIPTLPDFPTLAGDSNFARLAG